MPVSAKTLGKLMAAGLSGQELLDVVEAIDADMGLSNPAQHRTKAAERQKRYRENKASQNVTSDVTGDETPGLSSPSGSSPTPPSPNPHQSIPPSPPKGGSSPTEFSRFWEIYPNKTGRVSAETAFRAARKKASLENILDGARRYAGKTDDRPWCNPATWLSDERWLDEPAAQVGQKGALFSAGCRQLGRVQTRAEYLQSERAFSERSFRS